MLGYWDPFAELTAAQDRLFGNGSRSNAFRPPVDVYEDTEAVHIDVELPGIKAEDIKVDVEGDVLTIRGERKRENNTKKDGYQRFERAYGSFSRAFSLGQDVDAESVNAKYEHGVLKLTLNKKAASKRREISVKAA